MRPDDALWTPSCNFSVFFFFFLSNGFDVKAELYALRAREGLKTEGEERKKKF